MAYNNQTEKLPAKPEWMASYSGKVIYYNPDLTARAVELRDKEGRILAHVYGVHRIDISQDCPMED